MAKRKVTKKYYFSVEGETEQWYLKRLQELINTTEDSSCNVSLLSYSKKSHKEGKVASYYRKNGDLSYFGL